MRARSRTPGLSAWANGRPAGAGDASDPNKRYITLAPDCDLCLGWRLNSPTRKSCWVAQKILGITCALILTTTPGVEIGRRHFPLNVPFQNGPTRGKDVFVPIDYIIGGRKWPGKAGGCWWSASR